MTSWSWQPTRSCDILVRHVKNTSVWALNQEGGVEGRALTPSCENTIITTSCWTITDRKTLELTKKDTPHPKIKEKPQWDSRRGTITVKSNPITAGWGLRDWRTLIPQKSTHWSKGSEPHIRFCNLGVRQREEEFLENQTLTGTGIWLQDSDKTGGDRDSTLGGHTQRSMCIGPRRRSSDPKGDWTRLTC